MSSSKIFLYFCLSFIGGIFLNSIIVIHQPAMLGILIFGILLISTLWKYKKIVVIGFCLLFLVLGIWRHQQSLFKIVYPEERDVSFIGKVIAEPDIRETNTKLTLETEKIPGKILVTCNRYPQYQYGDKLKITGKLKKPPEFEGFNYKDYLAKDGIYSVVYWPKIELIERNRGNFVYAKILKFKNKLKETIYQNLSPPQSSILAALILGDKRQISNKWKEKLSYAGVRHLTAVSGMHVAILTTILMSFLIGLGFWRQQAFYFALGLMAFFILMTGLQPSAIRAGIMASLFLFGQYLGRQSISSRAIVFAGAVMLAQNPLLLKLDVGFQLSFLAMMGIIYLMPIFQNWFRKIPNFLQLRNIISLTLAAQIFTLPILIYNFGYFSLVAPITNILIVPFLPFIMGLGFIFAISGAIWQPLGWIFSLPSWFLLSYVTKIVNWFSSFSFAAFSLEISWIWLLFSYLMLGLITYRVQESQKLKFLRY